MQATKAQVQNLMGNGFRHQEYGHNSLLSNQYLQRRLNNDTKDKFNSIQKYQEAKNVSIGTSKKARKGPRGGVATPFPIKLYQLLESNEHSAIISWQPHGRCFIMHKPKEFLEQVMPRYFRQSKITSFQRQLNLYGFHRLTSGPDKGGYYHERFLRGKPEYCKSMLRVRIKGKGSKTPSNPAVEPNFYKMCPVNSFSRPCIEGRLPLQMREKKIIDSENCYSQSPTSESKDNESKKDTCISPQNPAIKIQKHILSPVCVSSTPIFDSLPQINPPLHYSDPSHHSSMHSFANTQGTKVCSPPELTVSALVDESDSMTFEGKEFHYIKSDSFTKKEEQDLQFSCWSNCIPTGLPRLSFGENCLDSNVPCFDPVGFEWSSGE